MQGSAECVNITFVDDSLSELLECFTLRAGFLDAFVSVPVCTEDNDGKAYRRKKRIVWCPLTPYVCFCLPAAAFVGFTQASLTAIESGIVEVTVELIGNVTYDVEVMIDVDAVGGSAQGIATAIVKS